MVWKRNIYKEGRNFGSEYSSVITIKNTDIVDYPIFDFLFKDRNLVLIPYGRLQGIINSL